MSSNLMKILYIPLTAVFIYGGVLTYDGSEKITQRGEMLSKEKNELNTTREELDSTKSKLTKILDGLEIREVPYNSELVRKLNGNLLMLQTSPLVRSSKYYCNEAIKEMDEKIQEIDKKRNYLENSLPPLKDYMETLGGLSMMILSLAIGSKMLGDKKISE